MNDKFTSLPSSAKNSLIFEIHPHAVSQYPDQTVFRPRLVQSYQMPVQILGLDRAFPLRKIYYDLVLLAGSFFASSLSASDISR